MFPINELFANAAKNMLPVNEQYSNTMKNMLPNNEQFANAVSANVETQLTVLTALTINMLESMQKLAELNLNAGKASWEDSTATAKQLFSARDPQEFLSLTVAQAQPAAAKAIAYSRHLAAIAAAAQAEFTRAREAQIAETSRKLSALVDEAFKGAPDGSENTIAIAMKSAIANANAGYEQITKTTGQAVESIEANMNTAVNQLSQSAEQTANAASGRARKSSNASR